MVSSVGYCAPYFVCVAVRLCFCSAVLLCGLVCRCGRFARVVRVLVRPCRFCAVTWALVGYRRVCADREKGGTAMHSTVTGAVRHSEAFSCQPGVIIRGDCLSRSTGRTEPQGVECCVPRVYGAAWLCGRGRAGAHTRTHGRRQARARRHAHVRRGAQGRARNMRDMELHTQYWANMRDTQLHTQNVWGLFSESGLGIMTAGVLF